MSRMPRITALFWLLKICATTLGETAGDLLSMTLGLGYRESSVLLFGFFLAALTCQLNSKRYIPLLFWTVILSTSTAGTTLSDYMDRSLALGYLAGSLILLSVLLGIFAMWRSHSPSLSVEHLGSRKDELFYWSAILFSNTLGTAFGDMLSEESGLGFRGAAFLLGGILGILLILFKSLSLSKTVLFWIAFVLTRPFGATLGDLLTKPGDKGGLDLGTAGSTLILTGILGIALFRESAKQSSAR
jgi:uncharacterized membrane-anchored protein